MLPQTVVHWLSSAEVGAMFVAEQLPIFKPMLNFFDILKANMAKNPERVMTR